MTTISIVIILLWELHQDLIIDIFSKLTNKKLWILLFQAIWGEYYWEDNLSDIELTNPDFWIKTFLSPKFWFKVRQFIVGLGIAICLGDDAIDLLINQRIDNVFNSSVENGLKDDVEDVTKTDSDSKGEIKNTKFYRYLTIAGIYVILYLLS